MKLNKSVFTILQVYFGLPFACISVVTVVVALSEGDQSSAATALIWVFVLLILPTITAFFMSIGEVPAHDVIEITLPLVDTSQIDEDEETRLNILASQLRIAERYSLLDKFQK